MTLPPSILSDQILADSSKKLSELDRAGTVLSSDLLTLERSRPKEIQHEILKEIESDVQNLIICLEDGYDDEHPEKARFLINEVKSVLENARLKQSYRAAAQTVFDIVFSGLSSV